MQIKLNQIKKNRFLQKTWGKELDFFLQEIFHLNSRRFIDKMLLNEKVQVSFSLFIKALYYTFLKKSGYPLAYIFQKATFLQETFFINKNVLIPRRETEELVHLIIEKYQSISIKQKIRILDIGTGSGIIALSLKKNLTTATVVAIDISPKAIGIAKKNAQKILQPINQKIEFLTGNVFSTKINEAFKKNPFDLIVTNPPYVGLKEIKFMDKTTLNYEPKEAFFAGEEGLDFFLKLKTLVNHWLKPQGKFYTEMGFQQSAAVERIFSFFQNPQVIKDLQGKNRIFLGEKSY